MGNVSVTQDVVEDRTTRGEAEAFLDFFFFFPFLVIVFCFSCVVPPDFDEATHSVTDKGVGV